MPRLEIKDGHSPDVDRVWEWQPDEVERVYVLLELSIGVVGEAGEDIFQLMVATPAGLLNAAARSKGGSRTAPSWSWRDPTARRSGSTCRRS